MRFVVLSHAGLLVEHNGVRIVCDPWLIGSCYWRSWWNFPEPDPDLIKDLKPQFIYLTHLHWDHFHGPSLQKLFDPSTKVIVPKAPTLRMVEDLRWLGFHDICEVAHGTSIPLGEDFRLWSYQFGPTVDSAAVLRGGGRTLFNCNDCKFFGLPLRQVLRDHPSIDFLFRSHSSASPVPLCIENHQQFIRPGDASFDSADQFARCAIYTGARYAIPFASNHCFLHPETRRYNVTATTPDLARTRYAALATEAGVKTECVVMPPGSSWDDATGFDIRPFDFSRREQYVEQMLQRNAGRLARQAAAEDAAVFDQEAFTAYFSRFIQALPLLLKRWLIRPVVFRIRDAAGVHDWLVDPGNAAIAPVSQAPPEAVVFEVHALVVNDCTRLRMFSVWSASKRLRIHLPRADLLSSANLWFTLLDLYEIDCFPLIRNLSLRNIGIRLRRWREPVEVAAILLRRLILRRRFSVSLVYPAKPLTRA
jgi:UDP-MurNAc hydroxylase